MEKARRRARPEEATRGMIEWSQVAEGLEGLRIYRIEAEAQNVSGLPMGLASLPGSANQLLG